jgi:hypothetical protein
MTSNNVLVKFSIFCIKKIWHGKIGREYKNFMGIKCGFSPSCSNYGILALEKFGFIEGWKLTFQRILRCKDNIQSGTIDYP